MDSKSTSVTKEDALAEGVKEFARVVLIAAVSAALVAAQAWAGLITDPLWNTIFVIALSAIGKAFDRFVHKNPETTAKGILPF